jgi:hypothetical protein
MVLPHGAAFITEHMLPDGAAPTATTMELSVVRAAGVDSGDNRVPIVGGEKPLSFYFKSTLMRGLPQWDYGLKIKTM